MTEARSIAQPLVWMDLEMSGLDPEKDQILEIAVVVSDGQVREVIEGPDLVIHQEEAVLSGMDEWNTEHHGASGLTEAVRRSELSYARAEQQILEFLQPWCEAGQAPLAGNSIHQDRAFLRKHMRSLHDFLHYRNVDVSTLKELVRRWDEALLEAAPAKSERHRALEDIHDSIAELRYYRQAVFQPALRDQPGD